MRLGLVQYLNALPFHIALNTNDLKLTFAHPTQLNALLSTKQLEGALTSSVAGSSYKQLPLGIACEGPVMSVALFLDGAPKDGMSIALTSASATSVALLKVLCHHFWRVSPHFVCEEEPHAGKLLIGDEALSQKGPRIDLGEAWKCETGLPFVFATLQTHPDIETTHLQQTLEGSLEWAERHLHAVVDTAHTRSSLPKPLLQNYYQALHYRLEEKEWKGLQLFSTLYKSLDVQSDPA